MPVALALSEEITDENALKHGKSSHADEGGGKPYRLDAHNFLLTFSEHINKAACIAMIMDRLPVATYIAVCHEHGEDGYKHTHAFVHCDKPARKKNAGRFFDIAVDDLARYDVVGRTELIHPNIQTSKSVKHAQHMVRYIQKEDTDVLEEGTPPDFEDIWRVYYDAIRAKPSWAAVCADYVLFNAIVSRMHWARTAFDTRPTQCDAIPELRPPQPGWLESLDAQNDRTVMWIVDEVGGLGKTEFAKWLIVNRDAFWCDGGKYADIACAYQMEKMAIFDLKKSVTAECWPYKAIEALKDGMCFSGKYQSCAKLGTKAKVLVLSNVYPDISQLSRDRWQIWHYDHTKELHKGAITLDHAHIEAVRAREVSSRPHAPSHHPAFNTL